MKILFIFFVIGCFAICSCQKKVTNNQHAPLVDTHSLQKIKTKKLGAPVSLAFNDVKMINEKASSAIEVALKVEIKQGKMRVVLRPSTGLELKNTNSTFYFDLVDKGTYSVTANLLAPAQGRYYLNLQVDIDHGEHSSSRVLAVIVQAGEPQTRIEKAADSLTANKVISLPAEEVIITP